MGCSVCKNKQGSPGSETASAIFGAVVRDRYRPKQDNTEGRADWLPGV